MSLSIHLAASYMMGYLIHRKLSGKCTLIDTILFPVCPKKKGGIDDQGENVVEDYSVNIIVEK